MGIRSLLACAVVAGAFGQAAGNVATWTSATVGTTGGNVTGTDHDWGAATSFSESMVQLPNGSRTSAYAEVTRASDAASVYAEVYTYDICQGNSATGAASSEAYGVGDMEVIQGTGPTVELQLTGLNPYLCVNEHDPFATTTVAVTLSRNGLVVVAGMITLSYNGSHNGSGIFTLDKFNITKDDGGTYTASYVGPDTVSAGSWLVNTPMDIAFVGNTVKGGNTVQVGAYPPGGGNTGHATLSVPEGYSIALVPEPASMALLLGGAGMLLGRRRRNAPCRAA